MESKNPNPIKRNEALVKFSKEHHYGLLLCWKIREGLKNNIDPKRIADYTLFFFDNDLKNHFTEEEKMMFSKLSDDDILKQQAINEHNNVYNLIEKIRIKNYGTETLRTFANDLDNHIRFEERVLFNHIQQKLSEDELLYVQNNHIHIAVDIDDRWDDRFWES